MLRHVALIVSLTFLALAGGYAMVPGEREQWTMLVRDGHNRAAMAVLEQRYRAGKREVDAVLHLYKLYMAFAEIDRATEIMRDFVADRPDDPGRLVLLAKHYGDIQEKPGEIRTLEHLFEVAPAATTARDLLAHYRLSGDYGRERRLMQTLLAGQMITANDAERLGLMLAAQGDLFGAREALTRFDEIANPERTIGRLALFDILLQVGDQTSALEKAASWMGYWRKFGVQHAGTENPTARLTAMMLAADAAAARRILCDPDRTQAANQAANRVEPACDPLEEEEVARRGGSLGHVEASQEFGRRRRK
ncbi:MAG: tetratricopeptide repeat protein [Xanthobacteraceae bacterium]